MSAAAITVDCPSCHGGGCHAIGRAPLGAPPDDVETNDCFACDATGQVPATRCDVCLATDAPIVAKEDDLAVCEKCHRFSESADKACPQCLEVICLCGPLARCGCPLASCDSCDRHVPKGELSRRVQYGSEGVFCAACCRIDPQEVHPTCGVCGSCDACACEVPS